MRKRDELSKPSCVTSAYPDEMMFVLLARDQAAPATIRHWVSERLRLGKEKITDPKIIEALECAKIMEAEYDEIRARVDPKVYVAGSSRELDRAERWMAELRARGVVVVSTWVENIRRVARERTNGDTHAASNPHQATRDERRGWARDTLNAVRDASVFWLLVPKPENPSQGAFFEFGFARYSNKMTIASGGDQRFIFTAVADHVVDADEEAFELVLEACGKKSKPDADDIEAALKASAQPVGKPASIDPRKPGIAHVGALNPWRPPGL